MINLLPSQIRRKAVLEYRLRLATVFCFMGAAAAVVIVGLLMPAYFFVAVSSDQSTSDEKSVDALLSGTQTADLAAQEQTTALLYTTIMQQLKYPRPSSVIDAVLTVPHSGVSIQRFEYTYTNKGIAAQLSGTALTRDALLSYKQAVANVPGVTGVTVPLTSLALSANLPFSITLGYSGVPATTSTTTSSTAKK